MTSKKFLALLDNPAWSALSQQQSTEHRAQSPERVDDKSVGLGWAAWAFRQSLRRLLCYKLVKINADLRPKSGTVTVPVPAPVLVPAACGRSAVSAPHWSGLGVQATARPRSAPASWWVGELRLSHGSGHNMRFQFVDIIWILGCNYGHKCICRLQPAHTHTHTQGQTQPHTDTLSHSFSKRSVLCPRPPRRHTGSSKGRGRLGQVTFLRNYLRIACEGRARDTPPRAGRSASVICIYWPAHKAEWKPATLSCHMPHAT